MPMIFEAPHEVLRSASRDAIIRELKLSHAEELDAFEVSLGSNCWWEQ